MNRADCEAEVRGLHDFFEAWFTGQCDREDLARLRASLAGGFQLVGPDGRRRPRSQVVDRVADAYGRHDPAAFAIEVDALRVRDHTDRRSLVAYEERQRTPSGDTARASTALLAPTDDPDAPEGVRWLHLQETWLPDGAPDPGDGE